MSASSASAAINFVEPWLLQSLRVAPVPWVPVRVGRLEVLTVSLQGGPGGPLLPTDQGEDSCTGACFRSPGTQDRPYRTPARKCCYKLRYNKAFAPKGQCS